MEIKLTWFIASCLASVMSFAQNLIPNGGFEDHIDCSREYCRISVVKYWESTSFSTPDYFSTCSKAFEESCSVPINFVGEQLPQSGDAYVGLFLFTNQFIDKKKYRYFERENIYVRLSEKLKKDSAYLLSLYISLAEGSSYFSKKISVGFSEGSPVKIKPPFALLSSRQRVVFKDNGGFKDSENWKELTSSYVAKGNEEYIIITLFKEDLSRLGYFSNKLFNRIKRQSELSSYYFIDSVSLTPLHNQAQTHFSHH